MTAASFSAPRQVSHISVITVNYNTAAFIIAAIESMNKLTVNPFDVRIIDNASRDSDYQKLKHYCDTQPHVHLERKEHLTITGSMAHGTALNELAKKIEAPYFAVLDADAMWLRYGWDDLLISKLNERVKVIGSESSGNKPKDFPLMYAAVFETRAFREVNGDFRPTDDPALVDTGMRLRELYHARGYQGVSLRMINTRSAQGSFFSGLVVCEYYLNDDPSIIASHYGRGSNLGVQKFKRESWIYNLPFLGDIIARKRGVRERDYWIGRCKEIVNAQRGHH